LESKSLIRGRSTVKWFPALEVALSRGWRKGDPSATPGFGNFLGGKTGRSLYRQRGESQGGPGNHVGMTGRFGQGLPFLRGPSVGWGGQSRGKGVKGINQFRGKKTGEVLFSAKVNLPEKE